MFRSVEVLPGCLSFWSVNRSKFTFALKSSNDLLMIVLSIIHEIVEKSRFLYFTGMEFDRISLILTAKNTFLGTLVALFLAQRSFKNLT